MPPQPTPTAAIVICAYTADRWDDTLAAIASAREQRPSGGIVVVVDHEEALRERLAAAVPDDVRVVANDGPRGLSGARNTGVAATDADVVAFLDDDARALPGWLAALLAPYADPAVVATGGRIEPAFDGGRPAWLPAEVDWIVGCTYRGMPETRADVRNVIGAGMAFRRTALEAAGGFDASVGRGRALPVGGEETELCIRARRVIPGARVVHEPAAIVAHRVRATRATVRYALTRGWAEGLTKARVTRLEGASAGLATETAYATRTLPMAVLRELRAAVTRRDPAAAARAAAIVAVLATTAAGFAAERVRLLAIDRRPGDAAMARPGRAAIARPATRAIPAADGGRALRILQVTARYAPLVGGVETHTEEVSKRLAARGHRVTVLTTDPTGTLPAHVVRDGVEVVRVRAWPTGSDWHLAPGLVGRIGRPRWDVVHLQGVHTLVPAVGALAAILASRPFVLTFHSGGHSSALRTAARGLQFRLLAPLLRRAAALVGVSRYESERFARLLGVPRDRVLLIRNGSGLEPTASPATGAGHDAAADPADDGDPGDATATDGATASGGAAPPPLDALPADAPLVLSLGRLERYKGHQRVIAAMPAVRAAHRDARLHVAGAGPYEPALRRQVAELGLEDVVTIGAVPRDAMPAALARAGVVTLLSDYEAHPVAVMEALAARRRVVVADTTGFRELAEDGLVRAVPADAAPEAAAAAIAEELARPAPEAAPDLPGWDDTADELEALYRRVAGR